MAIPREKYDVAYECFRRYLAVRGELCEAMAAVGLPTRNVDPLACFAEVIAARELGGEVVPRAANPDYDVLLPDGRRVQVKSLRVTTGRLADNGRSWAECTHKNEKPQNPLLDAELTALVVYLDHRPYALLVFPVVEGDRFPALGVKVLLFAHVEKLLNQNVDLAGWPLHLVDLRECLAPNAHCQVKADA